MQLKKVIFAKIRRGVLIIATVIILFALFTQCEKDPVKGWAFYLAPPEPPKIEEIRSIIKNCEPPYPVTFKATVVDVIGTLTYNWDFGDGTYSNDIMPTHIYTEKGAFKAKLRITNDIGSDTASVYLTELNQSSLPVIANFSYLHTNDNNFAPNKVTFTNKSSGANQLYWWFGDGTEDDASDPIHIFNSPGNYTVKLRGTCSNGTYNEYSQQIYVSPAPKRIFIEAINLMLPKAYNGTTLYIEMYHNNTYIGSTVTVSPSTYPIKFIRPNDFTGGAYFDYVQYSSNEVFKFIILKPVVDNPPEFLFEIDLSSSSIQNSFYPTIYYQIEPIPWIKDVFIDLYMSYN